MTRDARDELRGLLLDELEEAMRPRRPASNPRSTSHQQRAAAVARRGGAQRLDRRTPPLGRSNTPVGYVVG